jgi:hypothetical protein
VDKVLGEDWSWEAGSAGSGWSTLEKEKHKMDVDNNDVNADGSGTRSHEGSELGLDSGGGGNENNDCSSDAITNVKKKKLNPIDNKDTPRKIRRSIAMRNAQFNQSGRNKSVMTVQKSWTDTNHQFISDRDM